MKQSSRIRPDHAAPDPLNNRRRATAALSRPSTTTPFFKDLDQRTSFVYFSFSTAIRPSLTQDLEGLLYEDVPPDTKDSNGNSLLLLAAQQVGWSAVEAHFATNNCLRHTLPQMAGPITPLQNGMFEPLLAPGPPPPSCYFSVGPQPGSLRCRPRVLPMVHHVARKHYSVCSHFC